MLKIGDRVRVCDVVVSRCNMNVDVPFGKSSQDRALVKSVRNGLAEPLVARMEGGRIAIVEGSRRLRALKAAGVEEIEYGSGRHPFLLRDLDDAEALLMSYIENLPFLKNEMDPVARAQALSQIVKKYNLTSTAEKLGVGKSTLSEWLMVLELSPEMQQALREGKILFTDALSLAKLKLSGVKQKDLAKTLNEQGSQAYRSQVNQLLEKEGKPVRGLPAGQYVFAKASFSQTDKQEMQVWQWLESQAKEKNMEVGDLVKQKLTEQWKSQQRRCS